MMNTWLPTLLEDGQYHIDIPFSEETQIRSLQDAGFKNIKIIFRTSRSNVVAAKPEIAEHHDRRGNPQKSPGSC
jgi:hypothetical protein